MRREGKKLAQVARLQARGQLYIPKPGGPTHEPAAEYDAALAGFGLQEVGVDDDVAADGSIIASEARKSIRDDKCYLWPCNEAAFNVWQSLQSQWLFKPSGQHSGLNYAGVSAYLATILRVKPKARTELFSALQAMEFASLKVWQETR